MLNACYSETQALAIYDYIDCVIGMERAVSDKAAIHFSTAFYDALGAGRSYKEAFDFGCNNIDLNGIPVFLWNFNSTSQDRYATKLKSFLLNIVLVSAPLQMMILL